MYEEVTCKSNDRQIIYTHTHTWWYRVYQARYTSNNVSDYSKGSNNYTCGIYTVELTANPPRHHLKRKWRGMLLWTISLQMFFLNVIHDHSNKIIFFFHSLIQSHIVTFFPRNLINFTTSYWISDFRSLITVLLQQIQLVWF